MSQQKWGVTFIVMVAAFVAVIAIAANADDAIFEVPSQTRIPNGQHQIHWSYPTSGYQGCLADIEVAETNEAQPSAHPGNQLVVAIDGTVIVRMDIETGRGGFSVTTVQAVVGDVIEVWYEFGPDNVTSSGFAASITCQEVPPSTTIPPETTTTSSPPSSTTSSVPSTTTTTEVPTTTTTVPETATSSSTSTTGTETTSTSSPPSPSPSVTVPTSTVPETTPIRPTGVPTGEPIPETHSLWPAFLLLLAGVLTLVGAGTWAYSRGGDDEAG